MNAAADEGSPKGKVEFLSEHRPALKDGTYKVTVIQRVEQPAKIPKQVFSPAPRTFRVAGERFSIAPTEIKAMFPPAGSSGDHSMVLPHIVLNRSTLPWERYVDTAQRVGSDNEVTPWLGLFVLDEDEAATIEPTTLTYKDLKPTGAGAPRFQQLDDEQDDPDEEIQVIDVPWAVFAPQLRTEEELRLMAHVRQAKTEDGKLVGEQLAVLVAGRLPKAGHLTTVHVVSFERAYEGGTFYAADAGEGDTIRLVSLARWRFACQDEGKTFDQLVENLDRDPPSLRLPPRQSTTPNADATGASGDAAPTPLDSMVAIGAVPLPHRLRDGGKTVSFYRGPLLGGALDMQRSPTAKLPVAAADELLLYYRDQGIFDTSYAAAWELGRLLTLRSNRVAIELFRWKRSHQRELLRAEAELAYPHLPGHQPQGEPEDAPGPLSAPEVVADWFDDLRLLKHLPFNYLVPDEAMLPPESMRVFRIDQHWIDALLDGAFSIGRVTSGNQLEDRGLREAALEVLREETDARVVTGLLLRSEVVSGWPDLLVDGYATRIDDEQTNFPSGRLELLRMERLGPDVLLCLFEGEPLTIDIHQKAEALHFGLNPPDAEHSDYYKRLRSDTGQEPGAIVPTIPWKGAEAGRVVDMAALASAIAGSLPMSAPTLSPAAFALEMIEGVQKVRFTRVATTVARAG